EVPPHFDHVAIDLGRHDATRPVDRHEKRFQAEPGAQVENVFALRLEVAIHIARLLEDMLDSGGIPDDPEVRVVREEIFGKLGANPGVALHEYRPQRSETALDQ